MDTLLPPADHRRAACALGVACLLLVMGCAPFDRSLGFQPGFGVGSQAESLGYVSARQILEAEAVEGHLDDAGMDEQELEDDELEEEPEDEVPEEDELDEEFEDDLEEEGDEYDPYLQSLILRPREFSVSTEYSYSLQSFSFPVTLSDGSPGTERDRIRTVTAATELRYGLIDDIEVRALLPVRLLAVEFSDTEFEEKGSEPGLADTSAGITAVLVERPPGRANWLGTFDVNFPTGGDPFALSSLDNAIDSGFWIFTAGLEFVKSNEDEDLVLFGGAAYSHFLPETYSGFRVEKADAVSLFFGTSWYLNDEYVVEATCFADYQGNSTFDGVEALGTSFEPMAMRLSLGHELGRGRLIQPFVQFALNEDLSTTTFGVTMSRFYPGQGRRGSRRSLGF